MRSGLSHHITLRVGGVLIRFYPTPLCAEIWADPSYHRSETDFVDRYLRPGDTFIDVGANIGLVALTAAYRTGPSGRVIAIEAHPRIFRYLEGNVVLNGFRHVSCFNLAVGNVQGSVEFTDHSWDEINAIASGDGSTTTLRVPVQPLDEIVGETGPVNLLKVDVEGYEKFVIEGASRVLQATTCLYFESNREHYARYGYTSEEVFRSLRRQGFRLFRVADSSSIAEIPDGYESAQTENIIATRRVDLLLERTGWRA